MAVNYTDFDKIWASTSPLTPYSFTDANYKRGWDFVGSTPPSRQMWDAFMQHADEKLQYLYLHEDVPVGHEYFTFNPNVPQGSLPLFGGEYSRETYSALWSWVQQQTGYLKTESEWQALATANNGNVPYYSDGDGSTTFRVPSLKCYIKAADGTVTEVGSYYAAGLPNITGGFAAYTYGSGGYSGSFLSSTSSSDALPNGTGAPSKNFNAYTIDASRSNSIYGNSNTVTPETVVGLWLVKAYGVIQDTGSINEQQYIDDRIAAEVTRADGKYLPLTGGTITGNIEVDGTLKQNNENVLTSSFITTIVVSVTGTVSANSWADFTGNITYPTGYSHALSIREINLVSPANQTLIDWRLNDTNVTIRLFSKVAYSNQSFNVYIVVTK